MSALGFRTRKAKLKKAAAAASAETTTQEEATTNAAAAAAATAAQVWTWRKLPGTGAKPKPSWGHACAAAGTRLYIFGGTGHATLSDFWCWDALTSTWERLQASGSPGGCYGARMALADNRLWLFGGKELLSRKAGGGDLACFDLATQRWSTVSSPGPCRRIGHTLLARHGDDGKAAELLLFGGSNDKKYFDDAWSFDLTAHKWQRCSFAGTPPSARSGHCSLLVGQRLLLFGGFNGTRYLNDLHALDLSKSPPVWQQLSCPCPSGRTGHSASLMAGSMMLVFGGCDGTSFLSELAVFDCRHNVWLSNVSLLGRPPAPRFQHSADVIGDTLVVFGGSGPGELFADVHCLVYEPVAVAAAAAAAPTTNDSSDDLVRKLPVLYASAVLALQHSEAGRKQIEEQHQLLQQQYTALTLENSQLVGKLADLSSELLVKSKPSRRRRTDKKVTPAVESSSSSSLSDSSSTSQSSISQSSTNQSSTVTNQSSTLTSQSSTVTSQSSPSSTSTSQSSSSSTSTSQISSCSKVSSDELQRSDESSRQRIVDTVRSLIARGQISLDPDASGHALLDRSFLDSLCQADLSGLESALWNLTVSVKEAKAAALQKQIADLKRRQQQEQTSRSCLICVNCEDLVVLLPCRHRAICLACSTNVVSCPLCRATIADRLQTF